MQNAFSRRAALKTIILLAWPTILEQILQTAVQYVDTAMVGSLGPSATAAVGATTTVNWLINSSLSALGIGFLSYISHEIGARRPENARKASVQAMLAVLVTGILFTILPLALSGLVPVWMQVDIDIRPEASRYFFILYTPMLFRAASILFGTCLRAAGDTRTPLRVNIMVNVINIILNFLLIYPTQVRSLFGFSFVTYGADLGVSGAAIASAISFVAGGIGMTLAIYKHRDLSPRGLKLRPDPIILKPCLRVALPCALQRFGTSFGYVVFASMINSLNQVAMAAHSIANTAESAFYIPGYGMQTAAATLAGNSYGAGDRARMKQFTRMMIQLEVGLMLLSGTALFFGAYTLMQLFIPAGETVNQRVIDLGATVLKMVAVTEPIYGVSVVLEGIFQGVGDTKHCFVYNLLGMWGIRILGTWILLTQFGMNAAPESGLISAWACMIAHNIVVGILLSTRYLRGKWNPLNSPSGKALEA